MSKRMSGFVRSDYAAVFEAGGADALNRLLRQRYADPAVLDFELRRMERTTFWQVEWDEQTQEGRIVGRTAPARDLAAKQSG